MNRRPLTLGDVPDGLFAECGLRPRAATTAAYRCTDPTAMLVPIEELIGPVARKLNREVLADILQGFHDGADINAVVAYRDASVGVVDLLNGVHRWRASLAYGFTHIPCLLVTLTEALETGYVPR